MRFYNIFTSFLFAVALVIYSSVNSLAAKSQGSDEPSLSDAELGLSELMKTVRNNPADMMDTLQMLKDPEIAAEVKAMMADPKFQEDMKRFTASPAWKESMERAKDVTEKLSQDPVLMKQFESQLKK